MAPDVAVWSVCLVADDGDANELVNSDAVWHAMYAPGVHSLSFRPGESEQDKLASIVFELEAPSADAAEGRAQNLLLQGQKAAGIQSRSFPVAWVLPLEISKASWVKSMDEAKAMLDEERCELAVIAAHAYLELQVKALLGRAVGKERAEWVEIVMSVNGVGNLNTPICQKMIAVLLGINVTQMPQWSAFRAHAKRRNAAIHNGQALAQEEARKSLKTVESIVQELAAASRSIEEDR